jgi:hypothetical protein
MFQRRKGSKSNKSVTVSSISSVSDCERAINLSVNLIKTSDTNIINQCSSNTNIRVGIPSKIDLYTRKKILQKRRPTTLRKSCLFLTDEVIYFY